MHVPEGVLSGSASGIAVLGASAVLAAAGTAIGLRRMDYERVPRVAMLSAAFFVASLVQVPLGPTSEHLMLNGLVGLVLGWAAFPAILIALVLQSIFLPVSGGITTLGLNTLTMALPAVVAHYLFRRAARSNRAQVAFAAGMGAGVIATVLGAILLSAALCTAGQGFARVSQVVLALLVSLSPVEGLVTASAVVFLRKVRPELLEAPVWRPARLEVSDG